MNGQVRYLAWMDRSLLRANPEQLYLFGDNFLRRGLGGQAKHMRGEPNAIGIATKYAPSRNQPDYFHDGDVHALEIITKDLNLVSSMLYRGFIINVPRDGLGTGRSEMPQRAPLLHALIVSFFKACPGETCPWP